MPPTLKPESNNADVPSPAAILHLLQLEPTKLWHAGAASNGAVIAFELDQIEVTFDRAMGEPNGPASIRTMDHARRRYCWTSTAQAMTSPVSQARRDLRPDKIPCLDEILALERTMSWHVRFFSPSLNHDLLSPELPTADAAFEEAWRLAEGGEAILSIEGPDGEVASADEVELWFRDQGRTQPAANPS